MDFSLDTPRNLEDNILNKKLFTLMKTNVYNKMYGGGYIDNSNCVVMIIGVALLIVGFVLCWFKNDWVETKANIKNIFCGNQDNQSYTNSTECNISISYSVGPIEYSKIIKMKKSNIPTEQYISIYYQESEPNYIRLYNFNYSVIGIILIIFGIFILATSIHCSTEVFTSANVLDSESNLYSSTRNADGVSIVYTKS